MEDRGCFCLLEVAISSFILRAFFILHAVCREIESKIYDKNFVNIEIGKIYEQNTQVAERL